MTQHTDHQPLTDEREKEIRDQFAAWPPHATIPLLLAELDRVRAQRRYLIDQLAKRDAASGAADAAVSAFLAGEVPEPQEKPARPSGALLPPGGGQAFRALTPSEYNAAWHAVEGAAGEEGADPGTVLHAVLDRLGIEWQTAAHPAAGGAR